jgi:hypothetical protein
MRTVGRPALDLEVLEQCDVDSIEEHSRPTREVPQLKQIKETHHNLARLLASGMKIGEAGLTAGFTGARVSVLLADPSFRELIAGYRATYSEIDEEEFRGARAIAAKVTTLSARMTLDELEAADMQENRGPDGKPIIPLRQLKEIAVDFGSVSSMPKQSVNMQIDGNSLAEKMAAARARLDQHRESLPDASPVETLPPSRASEALSSPTGESEPASDPGLVGGSSP